MTAPIDQARLRELIGDAVLSACREYSDVKAGKIKDLLFHTRCIVENATDAIWDALSAERERADRAVGLLRRIDKVYADMQDGSGNHPTELRKVRAFLATQKAEGGA